MNLFITYYSVGHFISALLALAIGIYLLTFREKRTETYLLSFYLLAFAGTRFCGFVLDSFLDHRVVYSVYLMRAFMASGIILVAFAYWYQRPLFRRESIIVLIGFSISFLAAYLIYATRTLNALPYYDFLFHSFRYADPGSRGQFLGAANVVLNAWAAIVFLRKTVIFSSEKRPPAPSHVLTRTYNALRALIAPPREARTCRAFLLLTLLPLAMSLLHVFALRGIMDYADYELIVSIGSMLFMLFLTIVYVNNATQPTTLSFKITVIPLTAALTAIGLLAIPLNSSIESLYSRKVQKSAEVAKAFLSTEGGHMPIDVKYLVQRLSSAQLSYRNIYRREDVPPVSPRMSGANETTAAKHSYRCLDIRETSTFFITHVFTVGAAHYEIGFSYREYRSYVNGIIGYLIIMSLLIAVIIIVFFPVFFRQSVLGPLSNIISALNAFETGKHDISLHIGARDEFGRIGAAFTSMVKRIRRTMTELTASKRSLHEYNTKLEAMVDERTKELIAVNRNLREEIEARKNAEDMLERIVKSEFLDLENHPEVLAPYGLTKREEQILIDLLNGVSNRDIADKYGIAEPTAKVHSISIYRKFGVNSKSKLVKKLLSAL
ncbi:MAG: LuxR C-terminal-related transcriptional regulator [Spirochaetota bacterium]